MTRPSKRRTSLAPYVILTPAIVLFVLFLALPIGYTVYLAMRRTQVSGLGLGAGARREVFVGFDNFAAALADGELWAGWLRVLGYGALVLVVMLGLALLFALVNLVRAPRKAGHPLVVFVLLLSTFVLGLINAFQHAKDAWAVMPSGLVLSVIVGLLALAAAWIGLNLRSGGAK